MPGLLGCNRPLAICGVQGISKFQLFDNLLNSKIIYFWLIVTRAVHNQPNISTDTITQWQESEQRLAGTLQNVKS